MAIRKYKVIASCYDKRGRLISKGINSYEHTHPIQASLATKLGFPQKIFLHAEILAIIRAKGRLIHKIKIERYDSKGNPKLAKPCEICAYAIKEASIKMIEFTLG